jgi:hypothetical protein
MQAIPNQFSKGGSNLTDGTLKAILTELQGLRVSVLQGAAAGSKMDLAAIRVEDTILSAIVSDNAAPGALADDAANLTIQATKAFGTITISGNPVDGETLNVNGTTYTFKTTPTLGTHVKIAGTVTAMATALKTAINAHESRNIETFGATGKNTPQVVATSNAGVVTVTAVADGVAGNAIVLTEAATNVAVTGAGTLTSGTDTGGIKSTTNLTGKSVVLYWYNKK